MTRSEKIIWIFFAATSCQLAFQHPSFLLVAGERSNLFSGLLCFLTLIVAVVFGRRGAINLRSPEFLISAALAVVAGVSGLFSLTPLSSSFRVFVLLASGLGGFWCARILLQTPENQRRFTWLCLWILGGLLVLSFLGYFLTGYIEHFISDRSHPLTNVILLLSFAPLALLGQKSRPLMVLGIILLGLSYITLCLSERISVVFIPLGVCLVGRLIRDPAVEVFCAHLPGHGPGGGSVSPKNPLAQVLHGLSGLPGGKFSLFLEYCQKASLARDRPSGSPGKFIQDYQPTYPAVTKEQFTRVARDIVSADNQFLTLLVGLGLPFTLTYLAALGILLARLVGLAFKPPPGLLLASPGAPVSPDRGAGAFSIL